MFITLLSTSFAIVLVVMIHHEVMGYLTVAHFSRRATLRLLLPTGVLAIIITHVIGVWVFGFTYYLLFSVGGAGEIVGNFNGGLLDCVYFSFVNYTTLGYGDLVPVGYVRFLAGTESLVGLVLIAWSASFTYVEMQRTMSPQNN